MFVPVAPKAVSEYFITELSDRLFDHAQGFRALQSEKRNKWKNVLGVLRGLYGQKVMRDRLARRLVFLVENLDLLSATGDPDAQWEPFQLRYLNSKTTLTIENKARQIGWSWIAAAGAVAEAIEKPQDTHIFISINQVEAKEKIRYARQVIDCLRDEVRPKLVIDNQTELEFSNGSRLISHPCRPPRGKKATVYLDEFAHYPKDRQIYTAALPVITRGGRIVIGSSPMGASGVFWEIYTQSMRQYPGYKRYSVPWWEVSGLCKDISRAIKIAPGMQTAKRVQQFGNARIVEIHDNMVSEDFWQEYECNFVDESVAWITWDEIKANQVLAQEERLWYRMAGNTDGALYLINDLADAVRSEIIKGKLCVGVDIGRTRDLTEITGVEDDGQGVYPYRFGISLLNVEFDDQAAILKRILETLPVRKMLIDRNGIGMQLAEQISKFRSAAEGVNFVHDNRNAWSVELKLRLQRAQLPIPLDRDLSYQLHSMKRRITSARNVVFDVDASEKHHADKYWALALAVWGATRYYSGDEAVAVVQDNEEIEQIRKSSWR